MENHTAILQSKTQLGTKRKWRTTADLEILGVEGPNLFFFSKPENLTRHASPPQLGSQPQPRAIAPRHILRVLGIELTFGQLGKTNFATDSINSGDIPFNLIRTARSLAQSTKQTLIHNWHDSYFV